jgi:hypothetical protein
MKRLDIIGKTLLLLMFVSASAMAQQTGSENKDPDQEIDELDILITIVNENDQSTVIDEVISLPSVASQKAVKKNAKGLDKANNASSKARSKAQQRIKNILGDGIPNNASERLPSDIRRVIPPKKPPPPPKP